MKRSRLLKRIALLFLLRLPIENIAEDLRKIVLIFIPSGAIGLVVTGDKITVFEALIMIGAGIVLYISYLFIFASLKTKFKKTRLRLNKYIWSGLIFWGELFVIVAIILIMIAVF